MKSEFVVTEIVSQGLCQPKRQANWCNADRSNKASMCYDCKLPTKPPKPPLIKQLKPLIRVEMAGWNDVVDNRGKINKIIAHINKE